MSAPPNEDKIKLSFSINNCHKDIHYKISIIVEDKSKDNNEKFDTEEKQCIEEGSELVFSNSMSCNFFFDQKQKLQIKVTKKIPLSSSNYLIKEFERITVLGSIISSPNSIYKRKITEKEENSENIIIISEKQNKNINSIKDCTIYDFLKSGMKLSCFLSLDFSGGKGHKTLLSLKDNYINVLKNISDIISIYTKEQIFYTSGFGAKTKNSDKKSNIFNLNMNEKDSKIHTIDNVITFYNYCLTQNKIVSERNIYFSSIIKKITNNIYKLYEINYYNILFIIAHNIVDKNDIKKTIDSIIESCYLPLSIIIIYLGKKEKNDSSQITKIANNNTKFSSVGMEKIRNNVLFASLNDNFSNDVEKMVSWCIKEVSKQMIEYYSFNNTSPEQIQQNNVPDIEKSFDAFNTSICYEKSTGMNILEKSVTPFEMDNNPYQKNEEPKEDKKKTNENLDEIKHNNPYASDIISDENNNIDKLNLKKSSVSDKRFVNIKPMMYTSVLNNSINVNESKNVESDKDNKKISSSNPIDSNFSNTNNQKDNNEEDKKK
jgi:hypothetical protein